MTMNRQFLLVRRPGGELVPDDFSLVETAIPTPANGEIVIRNHYASLDPAQRGWMDDAPSYMPPIPLGDPVRATTIGVVHASANPDFGVGDWVLGLNGLEDYSLVRTGGFTNKIDVALVPSPTVFLSGMGAVGLTAYFGVTDVLKPQAGETLLVSGAAGAVGSVVGQIGKIMGCRTIGIAGGAEKCRRLTQDYGYDVAIDYRGKSLDQLTAEIGAAAPSGVNMIFENVGGDILDAGLINLADEARILICGLISEYNNAGAKTGARNIWQILVHRATMHGFLIMPYIAHFEEGGLQMAQWASEGKMRVDEDVQEGLENAFSAYARLFSGANTGKLILKIA
jgi:NADPH-dependent curcumin reductase CurA